MTAWLDNAVFCALDTPSPSAFGTIAALGFNAVRVRADVDSFAEVVRSAAAREVRVAVEIDGELDERVASAWLARGADALFATHASRGAIEAANARDACVVAQSPGAHASVLRTSLFAAQDAPAYFDGHGHGDFAAFWKAASASAATIALVTSDDSSGGLSVGREIDDLEVVYAFLLTWPCVPVIRYGDERGVEALLERLIYLRLTERDLAATAPVELVSDPSPGYPLVYRRGKEVLVAINAAAAAHRVALAGVGDARPIAARHCHLAHDDGRWCARLGPAGYGLFDVT